MISPELSTVVQLMTLLAAVIAVVYARFAWYFCKDTEEFIKLQNKRSLTLSKLAEIETELTELKDAYDSLLTSHKKLRSRIGMRENRAAKGSSESQIPDSTTDPAGFKRAMRLKLQNAHLK